MKPVKGSASINISKVYGPKEIEVLFDLYDDLMIPGIYGRDGIRRRRLCGYDIRQMHIHFPEKKIKMRAGETDKSVSVKDEGLFALIRDFVEKCGFAGMIDIDIFQIGNEYYISEVNPRFGGGYPHAYECGVNMPAQVARNLEGRENEVSIGAYQTGICMMKYNEVMIKEIEDTEIIG